MLVLIGASASGKTEIAKTLIKDYGFEKMVTTTTRKKRIDEVQDVDYHFITLKKFLRLKEEHKFLETTLYNNTYYGTPLKGASINKVLIVDPNGANSIYEKHLPDTIFVLLKADEETRKNRMMQRGDNLIQVLDRLHKDDQIFDQKNVFHIDFVLDSSDLSVDNLALIINNKYYEMIKK